MLVNEWSPLFIGIRTIIIDAEERCWAVMWSTTRRKWERICIQRENTSIKSVFEQIELWAHDSLNPE